MATNEHTSAKQIYWHKHNRTKQVRRLEHKKANLINLPSELKLLIFQLVFAGTKMFDISMTVPGDYRRRYADARSLLLVSKKIRKEAVEAFFKTCEFQVHHFKLHSKRRRMNPMTSLTNIRNLRLLWTPSRHSEVTSKRAEGSLILGLENLKELTIDLIASEQMGVAEGDENVQRNENIMERFERCFQNLPRRIKRLLEAANGDVKVMLDVYVYLRQDDGEKRFTVSKTPARLFWMLTSLRRATILWPNLKVLDVKATEKNAWKTERKTWKKFFPRKVN